MKIEGTSRTGLSIFVFCFALLIRFCNALLQSTFGGGDSGEYRRIAENLVRAGVFSLSEAAPLIPTVRRPPLYPFFLALTMSIGDEQTSLYVAILVQCLLDAITAILIFILIQAAVRNNFVAITGAMFYALHPGAIVYSSIIGTESLATFLLTLAVTLLVFGIKRERWTLFALSGAVFGAAALCRPVLLLFVLILPAVILVVRPLRRRTASVSLLAIMAVLTITPWIVRSYVVSDRFVLIQGLSIAQFYLASRYDLDQSNEEQMMIGLMEPTPGNDYIYQAYTAKTPTEMIDAEKLGREQAIANITKAPGAYLRSRVERYPYLFLNSFDRLTGLDISFGDAIRKGNYLTLAVKLTLMFVFCIVPLVLGVPSLRLVRRNYVAAICGAVWGFTLLIHLPFWIEYRFWTPVVPLLTVSAAVGLSVLLGRYDRGSPDPV